MTCKSRCPLILTIFGNSVLSSIFFSLFLDMRNSIVFHIMFEFMRKIEDIFQTLLTISADFNGLIFQLAWKYCQLDNFLLSLLKNESLILISTRNFYKYQFPDFLDAQNFLKQKFFEFVRVFRSATPFKFSALFKNSLPLRIYDVKLYLQI